MTVLVFEAELLGAFIAEDEQEGKGHCVGQASGQAFPEQTVAVLAPQILENLNVRVIRFRNLLSRSHHVDGIGQKVGRHAGQWTTSTLDSQKRKVALQ